MTRHDLIPFWRRSDKTEGNNPLTSLHSQIDRLFHDVMGEWGWSDNSTSLALQPTMDVAETDSGFEIKLDLPGMVEKDVEVSTDDDVLMIRGTRESESEDTKKNYHVRERSFGACERRFRLPSTVDAAKTTAEFRDGVLTVHLPKSATAKSRKRKISVKKAA
ncbi:MAG: Hsp20/alpha crystallin family protein [Alphaproteobacteria bacterium]